MHIIGIDNEHKKILMEKFKDKNIIDLDKIQRHVLASESYNELKQKYLDLNDKIIYLQKEIKIAQNGGSIRVNDIIDKKNRFILRRNDMKYELIDLWKELCQEKINNNKNPIFIGYNIYPKLFSQKFELNDITHKVIFNTSGKDYAKLMVDNHLKTYHDKIVGGLFPLKMLDISYIQNRYEKIINHYEKVGYQYKDLDEIIKIIEMNDKKVYIALSYNCDDTLPAMEGFLSSTEAINNLNVYPLYLYETMASNFNYINNKLISNKPIKIIKKHMIRSKPN